MGTADEDENWAGSAADDRILLGAVEGATTGGGRSGMAAEGANGDDAARVTLKL